MSRILLRRNRKRNKKGIIINLHCFNRWQILLIINCSPSLPEPPAWDFPQFTVVPHHPDLCFVHVPFNQLSFCVCETAVCEGEKGCDGRETMTVGRPTSVFRLHWPVSSVIQRFQLECFGCCGRKGRATVLQLEAPSDSVWKNRFNPLEEVFLCRG